MAAVDFNMNCLLCAEECVRPVTLGCEHRFCRRCLRDHWAPSDSGDCPTCERRSSKGLPPIFALEKRDSSQSSGEKEEEGMKLRSGLLTVLGKTLISSHTDTNKVYPRVTVGGTGDLQPSALWKSTTSPQTSQRSQRGHRKRSWLNPKLKPTAKKVRPQRLSDPGPREKVPKVSRKTKSFP